MPEADAILVVDDAVERGEHTSSLLRAAGLNSVTATTGAAALLTMRAHPPAVVFLELNGGLTHDSSLLQAIRSEPEFDDTALIVATDSNDDQEVVRVLGLGADDCVSRPFSVPAVVARLRSQLRGRRYVDRAARNERDLRTVVQLTQALASSLDIRDVLFTVVRRVAELTDVDRCSIVLVQEKGPQGYVVASSDDESLRDLPIDLDKYPEIREVLATRVPLVVEDTQLNELLATVRQDPGFRFRSLTLAPILYEGETLGVLFLRARRKGGFVGDRMAMVHTLANATAIAIRNARVLQSLRSASEHDALARQQVERRMKLLQRYADFFESAADGMVVADRTGHILYANPMAAQLLGVNREVAVSKIQDLLGASEAHHIEQLVQGFRAGVYPQGVDVQVRAPSGQQHILCVNFSSVLRAEHAVLCTFRDVTSERRTEEELRHTKEFLERVIESSVDAIVSADMTGKVLLFNRAASRVFGYDPKLVIGKMNVEKLYPSGVARRVMHQIRGPDHGGPDRLEEFRVDMLSASGELLPVKLSAALIYDKDKPAASVGIFTDIRQALSLEAELSKAQHNLREHEKNIAVAELAGATAHELNQPLTAVMGYAELLLRHLESPSPLYRAASVIVSESERMAQIVRKIGRITKYETMTYVGGTQILDLDRASGSTESTASGEPREDKPR